MLIDKKFYTVLVGLLLVIMPGCLQAAPFCVSIQGVPPLCHYYDATQCQRRSYELSGICTANPDEFVVLSGSGAYCVVNSNHYAACAYSDRATCEREAYVSGAVCIDNTASLGKQPDLYRLDPNRSF